MIFKQADCHVNDLATLEELKARCPSKAAAIAKEIRAIRAGASGEESAAYFLRGAFADSDRLAIINDLRFDNDGDFTQIDHLLIHRYQRAAWVLETKNYKGRLTCNEHGDWTVWYAGKRPHDIPSPISQVQRQCEALARWFADNGIEWIQTIHPVVLISPTSSVNRKYLPTNAQVVKSDNFATWWADQAGEIGVGQALMMFGRHLLSGMSEDDFRNLGERLVAAHVPQRKNWEARFGLSEKQPVTQPPAVQVAPATAPTNSDFPEVLTTADGDIRIRRLPDGRFSIRNDGGEALIARVRSACKGRGQWIGKYRNWLVAPDQMPAVVALLAAEVVVARAS